MSEFPADSNGIIFRRHAIDNGFSDNQLARAVKTGELHRVWPGAFVPRPTTKPTPEQWHRKAALAAATLGEGSALCHESAALVHGMSLLHPRLDRVHLATGCPTGGRIDGKRHLHSGLLDDAHVTRLDGVTLTTLERTAVDIACTSNFAVALAVIDSALRLGADPVILESLLRRHKRGVAVARRAFHHADPGAENAGESWGRAQMIMAGLPVPRLQHEFFDTEGDFIARCDYDWAGKLAAEFDGMRKYERDLRPDETPFDAMRREKNREDALRRVDVMVIRWVWDDLRNNRVVPMVREWLDRFGIAA